MSEPTKYVCTTEDLDLLLGGDLKRQFQSLFSGNWRMRYVSSRECERVYEERTGQRIVRHPSESDVEWRRRWKRLLSPIMQELGDRRLLEFFGQFGIDYDHPTVRDAVAFDLVKLDDDSVSNDSVYTYEEHDNYSPSEYERYLLHRNFRINLVNLDPDWSEITYENESGEEVAPKRKRTVDKVFQGPRLSSTLLDYFSKVMDGTEGEIYIPFTNANDFSMEVSLIPNTHPDFRQITSRAYYDTKWAQYRRLCQKYGFANIATFALVDAKKDKNHTGEFLVKFQRKLDNGKFKYLTVKMDKDGQIVSEPTVSEEPTSSNTILCVCEDDYDIDRVVPQYNYDDLQDSDFWHPEQTDDEGNPKGIRDIPMVHSTTSSHYSVFRQRIPDYDLKLVRHYLQFRNRLEGMELCLEQLRRDVHRKEVRSSECFAKLAMTVKRLMDGFTGNEELMSLLTRWYDLHAEWDGLVTRRIQIQESRTSKLDMLHSLQAEYRSLDSETQPIGRRLDHKLALGQRIASLKMEIDRSVEQSIKSIQDRIDEISDPDNGELKRISDQMAAIQSQSPDDWRMPGDIAARIRDELDEAAISHVHDDADAMVEEMRGRIGEDGDSAASRHVDYSAHVASSPTAKASVDDGAHRGASGDSAPHIDTTGIHALVVQSERWRNYSFNIGYELSQFKRMLTMCEDATIKVRRLVHNFEERMADTQGQVWDESHQLRPDFDFKDITVAGLRDIILLHDWWAANAPGKTPEEMGMTDEEFKAFRRRCNKVSYNLRKNQYYQLLHVQRDRVQNRISELESAIRDMDTLHWDDRYGADAERDGDGAQEWSAEEEVGANVRARIGLFARAESAIAAAQRESDAEKGQWRADARRLVDRTMDYLRSLGLAKGEADVERLALANASAGNPEVSQRWLDEIQTQRERLDSSIELMRNQRKSMQSIIDSVAKMETAIQELTHRNKRIFDICMKAGKKVKGVDKQVRNRMLMDKIANEQRIFELKQLVRKAKSQHLDSFSSLERMRKEVDERQAAYDQKVRDFKTDIGLTKEVVDNLMVGIYNKFQDEILEHDNKRNKK